MKKLVLLTLAATVVAGSAFAAAPVTKISDGSTKVQADYAFKQHVSKGGGNSNDGFGVSLQHDLSNKTAVQYSYDKLLQVVDKKCSVSDAFSKADEVLRQGIKGISDLIQIPGLINLDFADVKTIMTNQGEALMGIGEGTGENRAADAAKMAINSPLLETAIDGAKGILLNISGSSELGIFEVNEAAQIISDAADPDANIIFGSVIDESLGDKVQVTVVATGFGNNAKSVPEFGKTTTTSRPASTTTTNSGIPDIPVFMKR